MWRNKLLLKWLHKGWDFWPKLWRTHLALCLVGLSSETKTLLASLNKTTKRDETVARKRKTTPKTIYLINSNGDPTESWLLIGEGTEQGESQALQVVSL